MPISKEIWNAEKAAVQGSAHLKEKIERTRVEIARLQREGKLDQVAQLQYGELPQLEAQLKQVTQAENRKRAGNHSSAVITHPSGRGRNC